MSAAEYNIEIESGSSFPISFQWTDDNDNPIPLSSYQAYLQVRDKPGGRVLVSISSQTVEIELSDNGEIIIDIPGNMTDGICGNGVWDLLLIAPGGERTRLVQGKVKLDRGVTEVA